jgi:polyferredoxin
MDVLVLAIALSIGSYLVLKKRSRRWIFTLMVFSLVYFGFYREGCVCSIGAIQNMTLAIFDKTYAIPIAAAAFFTLPLIFTLFFGRSFCAAVCPLGAIQDLVLLRPISVPRWLEECLRVLAYVYLGAAVMFAAMGSGFIICRYDPFVSFFRLSGNLNVIIIGTCLLVIGIFVGRPYCRFLCPYGVILRQLGRISKLRVTITPDECIQCRLCEGSCPFGAITEPTAQWAGADYKKGKRRLGILVGLLPVFIIAAGLAGWGMSWSTARLDANVRLAERIEAEDSGQVTDTTDASLAFRGTGKTAKELYAEANLIRDDYAMAGWLFGGFVGFVAGMKLILLSVRRQRNDYEADQAGCVGCGRCFEYCPREHVRNKNKETIKE